MENFEFLETYPNSIDAEVNANLLKSQGIKVMVIPNETGGSSSFVWIADWPERTLGGKWQAYRSPGTAAN